MPPESELKPFEPAASVLFLGSGFSPQARNIAGNYMLEGNGLKTHLATLLGEDPTAADLKSLADEVYDRPDLDLYQILYEQFTAVKLSKSQQSILDLPWLRIYTTNYDDVVELGRHKDRLPPASFCHDDPKPAKIPPGAIIHLHGSIKKATRDNIQSQLILNESSYIRQHFETSPWYEEFVRDIRFSDACYFLGYSLADYHISALLMQNPTFKQKTYFVCRSPAKPLFSSRVSPYGTVLPIGVDGFAEGVVNLPKPPSSPPLFGLKAFSYLDPFKDKKSLLPPTALETLNLVTFGTFNFQRCLSTLPSATYVAPRPVLVEQAIAKLKKAKTLVIHSWLGNGKTIFSYILAHRLTGEGYKCFISNGGSPTILRELQVLANSGRVVIIFDNYNDAVDLIPTIVTTVHDVKFVVLVRTGVQEVRLHEIYKRLPSPVERLSLNELSKEDLDDFGNLLDWAGAYAGRMPETVKRAKNLRDVLVSLYDNAEIKSKVSAQIAPLLAHEPTKSLLVASHLLRWAGHEGGDAFLRAVTGHDPFAATVGFREEAADLLKIEDGSIEIRSAVFSEYVIFNHFTSSDITDSAYKIIIEAVKRKSERRYQGVLSYLMQASNMRALLKKSPNADHMLVDFYEKLRRDVDVNEEPLFWLQYAILMADTGDLRSSNAFLETAYSRADKSRGFQTFQLDTYAVRLFITTGMSESGSLGPDKIERLISMLSTLSKMLDDEGHRFHAVHALGGIDILIREKITQATILQKNLLIVQLNLLSDRLRDFSDEARARTEADKVRLQLEVAIKSLL